MHNHSIFDVVEDWFKTVYLNNNSRRTYQASMPRGIHVDFTITRGIPIKFK